MFYAGVMPHDWRDDYTNMASRTARVEVSNFLDYPSIGKRAARPDRNGRSS
jgi:hypothetical protein